MKIVVTGIEKQAAEGLTIAQLIADENVESPAYVTVSLNDTFVEQGAFPHTVLHEGDSVEFLYFMGGGRPYAIHQ
ncbi:MAG: sulfur carrier protein ThiS [Oscillospiraceae bacterium]|jgi:sulfur carrier protein|nr:sulfur carrier protein ThiS [Oscillospiraceae bacterium]